MLERHGDRIAKRILTAVEMEFFSAAPHQASYIAKRFAAKEAAAKALGCGFRDGLSLRHIEVVNDSLGRPQLRFYSKGLELYQQFGLTSSQLSLSDEGEYAQAFVILEC